ncbi:MULTISPECIES: lytic transglycosylase domain-containing protein [Klebsiella pneumoniae complex]|uniref:lytic transglycosylase domain-containing protein n=1 Tax=Klebsiella pneumoniae complex TaxID=3390273 RepID=UPI0022974C8D|nr:lytic transglycosylase domain-containing protein [Klebsiella pneumoniae]HCD3525043.1 lytic transglycosylase domain-containing protein [Klebsiella pneumoniae]HCD3696592.1 lytic transglycosylase domain-containing protein [Klebsiella pneumoniae]HCD4697319.1 lytic transglycosylase domain-containing protein [Klebsiella pneumoniae]HCD5485188.1 lytic transglycosylase domain-containing protein [Klebsiella pneumoniae]HCW0198401.1 lytic transglycosylase domain-containing protein [Klebsiella pneumonia
MNAETLKDFLISLGFKVDDAGARKFDAIVTGATLKAIELGTKVELAAASVVAFTAKVASGLDNLYWASQRTGATVQGIKQIGFAVSQMGGSVDAARGSLESLAQFIRTSPGAEGFLNRLGVQTRDASGNMRDMTTIFTGVGQRLSSMPYYRANQYAQMLGMDENTLLAMRRGIGEYMGQYNAMKKAIGFNPDQAAAASNRFMTSLRSFGEMAGMARDKIGSNLAGGLAGAIDNLRRQILDNFPKIERTINAVVKGILWMGEAVGRGVYRLIQAAGDIRDWWKGLDEDSRKLIGTLGGMLVAWRLLNAAMLASPITWVLALAGALLLLYDDYKTWKEGGKSLIDWDKWEPAINFALTAIEKLWTGVKRLKDELIKLFGIDPKTWSIKFEFDSLKKQFNELSKMLDTIGKLLNAIDEGRWSDAAAYARQLLNQGGEPTPSNAVTDSANSAADWIQNKTGFDPRSIGQAVTGWFGGEATQYGQSVKRPQASKAGAQLLGWMAPMMGKLEALYNLPAGLLRSVALAESNGNQFAVSGAGAQGMFQFMPGTARDMGLRGNDVFNPMKAAEAAARYLSMLLQKNGGDLNKTLASYNWGIGNVQKYGMALMPGETRQYIPKVLSNMPGSGATLNQETNIHIHGVNNPREAANLVVERQNTVNNRATQDLGRSN